MDQFDGQPLRDWLSAGGELLGTCTEPKVVGAEAPRLEAREYRLLAWDHDGRCILNVFWWEITDHAFGDQALSFTLRGEQHAIKVPLDWAVTQLIVERSQNATLREQYLQRWENAAGKLKEPTRARIAASFPPKAADGRPRPSVAPEASTRRSIKLYFARLGPALRLSQARSAVRRNKYNATAHNRVAQALVESNKARTNYMNSGDSNPLAVKAVVGIMIVAALSLAVGAGWALFAGKDEPGRPGGTGSCPSGVDHKAGLDPMSAGAQDLRDAGYLVGSDGDGGSCVKLDEGFGG